MLSAQHWIYSKCQDIAHQGKADIWIIRTLTLTLTLKLLGTETDSFCFLCSQHVTPKWPHHLQISPGDTPEVQMISQGPQRVCLGCPSSLPLLSVNAHQGPTKCWKRRKPPWGCSRDSCLGRHVTCRAQLIS